MHTHQMFGKTVSDWNHNKYHAFSNTFSTWSHLKCDLDVFCDCKCIWTTLFNSRLDCLILGALIIVVCCCYEIIMRNTYRHCLLRFYVVLADFVPEMKEKMWRDVLKYFVLPEFSMSFYPYYMEISGYRNAIEIF